MHRILVVEDYQAIAIATKMWLCASGFDVAIAANGAEALKELHAADFDLILCDIGLPDMNGVELMRRIRATKVIPAISFSARYKPPVSDAEMATLFAAHIKKPFDPEHMEAMVRKVLDSNDPAS